MKRYVVTAAVAIVVIVIVVVVIWEQWSLKQDKDLQQVLNVNHNEITRLEVRDYGVITDDKQITDFIDYLDQYQWRKKREDSIDLPRHEKDTIWVVLRDDQGRLDILHIFDTEAMISLKAYTVIDGPIDMEFLLEYKNLAQRPSN